MLDKRNKKLLKIILSLCDNNYKVVDIKDILFKLPKQYKINNEMLLKDMNYLKDCELIDLKYHDNEVVCICSLPKGRMIKEQIEKVEQTNKNYYLIFIIFGIMCALCSFIGSLIGSFIK